METYTLLNLESWAYIEHQLTCSCEGSEEINYVAVINMIPHGEDIPCGSYMFISNIEPEPYQDTVFDSPAMFMVIDLGEMQFKAREATANKQGFVPMQHLVLATGDWQEAMAVMQEGFTTYWDHRNE